jgi:hypothetical protein
LCHAFAPGGTEAQSFRLHAGAGRRPQGSSGEKHVYERQKPVIVPLAIGGLLGMDSSRWGGNPICRSNSLFFDIDQQIQTFNPRTASIS